MSKIFTFLFCVFPILVFSQQPSGGGTFNEYRFFEISKVSEFEYNYSGSFPCDSSAKIIQYFNKNGQMTKESFRTFGGYYSHFLYAYNEKGFLIDIDTNGRFNVGYGISRCQDSIIQKNQINESWICYDTIRRIKERVISEKFDSVSTKHVYTYTLNGRILADSSFVQFANRSFEFVSSIHYEYKESELIEKIIHRDEEGRLTRAIEYKYEYF